MFLSYANFVFLFSIVMGQYIILECGLGYKNILLKVIEMKKNKKEKLNLCFKYNMNCKICPRNKKCDEEIKKNK